MRVILTETQFERLKKNIDCPFILRFGFIEAITLRRGRRNICVDEEIYNLVRDNQTIDVGKDGYNPELMKYIFDYYKDAYHFYPNEITIQYITGDEIHVRYQYQKD